MGNEEQPVCAMEPKPEPDEQVLPVLGRDEILAADDTSQVELLEVPEWGGAVYLRILTGFERDKFEQSMQDSKGRATRTGNLRARLASQVLCDPEGNKIFSESDVIRLGKKSAAALDRVYARGLELAGLTEDEQKALEGN